MLYQIVNIDNTVIFFCALVGSVKSSAEFDKNKNVFTKVVDTAIGVITGVAVVYHFANELSLALSALVAVVGGASGAMVLDVIMTMLPSVTKFSIKAWLKKWLNQ